MSGYAPAVHLDVSLHVFGVHTQGRGQTLKGGFACAPKSFQLSPMHDKIMGRDWPGVPKYGFNV